MKTRIYFVMFLLIICLTGCGSAEPAASEKPFAFTYNDVEITPHAEAAPILVALGTPKSCTEETSCAFDGLDKTYGYGSFYISTYPLDGVDHIYQIWFTEDSAATEEGIRIGDDLSEVESAYGAEHFIDANTCILTKGQTRLTILLTDGLVGSIQYEAVIS